MTRDEYERLRKIAEQEYQEKVKALDLVWSMAEKLLPAQSSRKPTASQPKIAGVDEGQQVVTQPTLAEAMRAAIRSINGEFSTETVRRRLREMNGTEPVVNSFNAAFSRLRQAGEVEVVVEASGRRAGVYKRGEALLQE